MSRGFSATGDSKPRGGAPTVIPPVATVKQAELEPAAPPMDPIGVRLEYSIESLGTGPLPKVLQAQRFTERQAIALQALHASLHAQSARMSNGEHVDRRGDALKKVLDDVADQMGLP